MKSNIHIQFRTYYPLYRAIVATFEFNVHNTKYESRSKEKIISESIVCRKINGKEVQYTSLGNRELEITSKKIVLDFTCYIFFVIKAPLVVLPARSLQLSLRTIIHNYVK